MQLIEQEFHFWELYQNNDQYYLGIAVDMSSVVSCWDLVLSAQEILDYQNMGRESVNDLAQRIIDAAYKGDFSMMESRVASAQIKAEMQMTYRTWRINQNA
ncbi:hypothetical protein [Acinetobacter sp. ANC 4648]|uniref:hypothetical protein n=1 Tax=Acinetobacter sp. ANC 4648 TaxID=1977875 RepID=UPI000A3544ED|nr:hypothetical protein [Acinetobacter sp. ANC 4648]OTG85125.1 hypothetical protein B9T27_02645 [Acinetobacter sp. ANC 4648]